MGNLKISKETRAKAIQTAKDNGLSSIFVNDKGEFFSNENFARLSVDQKVDRYAKIDVLTVDTDEKKGTNDTGTVTEVVAAIEAATDIASVEAILKAENEGKGRKTVIEAAEKKIKQFKPEE
ncbi:hypothetical protein [Limibacterium fermenti]|uniref:hypothetical protein n=1 Tax=Limibacterium fermenti TaxID=3229863 RepID=UPI003A5D47AC